jgi:hypothetical protein
LKEFLKKVVEGLPEHEIDFKYDIIRITPRQGEVDG